MKELNELVENIIIERNKTVDTLILGEIQKIATENGIDTKIILNEKAIVSALEKQIPMRVEYYDDGDYAKCPNCDYKDFENGINDWECNFCSRCGQALDWSDTE